MLKFRERLLSGLLVLAMLLSLCAVRPTTAWAAGEELPLTGSIGLTLRFGLPQTLETVKGRNITLTVSSGGKSAEVSLSSGSTVKNDFGARISVTAKNTDGVEMTTERQIGYYEVLFSGLPAGQSYGLTVTGTGYAAYSMKDILLDDYSKHIILGTGNGTFSLGDVNGDGKVSRADLEDMSRHLGQTTDLVRYDLNGDGKVDVTDLAYVQYMVDVKGRADQLNTAAIVRPLVDTAGLTLTASAQDLFTPESAVTLAPAAAGGALELPIAFEKPVEMSEVVLTCPDAAGAIQAGTAVVEYQDTARTVSFDASAPEGFYSIGENPGERVVTIDLGKKLPVKRITIQVTRVAGQAGQMPEFATVTQIEFLQDIVPKNPQKDASQVNGVSTVPGDGKVGLAWNAVNNVTGYVVAYGTSRNDLKQSITVKDNRASVSGLENLTEYFFQVTAANGEWRGTPSEVASGTPYPASIPGAPSNIRVESRDGALRVSWGKTKDATCYQLFFREAGTSEFRQSGGTLESTSAVITGLTNGTAYEVAVKAGNAKGFGPYSAVAKGTPEREVIELPALPTDGRIPNDMVESVTLANPNNVDRNLCPNFAPGQLTDSDATTYWVARTWWDSSEITYTFTEPQDMNYMILVPYLGGGYKNAIKNYGITAKDGEGNVLTSGSYRAQGAGDKNYLLLTFPAVKGVKSLSVSLAEWEGNGCRVSVSEAAFYQSDSLPDGIAALFANSSFTQLSDGVTAERIATLESRLDEKSSFYLDPGLLRDELELAKGLLADGTGLGTVRSGFQSRSGGQDADYKQTASDLQPLGVSVAVPDAVQAGTTSRTTVAVYAELPGDAPVYILPTQFFGESGIWRGAPVQLVNGRNYISIPQIGNLTAERGGPLYLTYAGSHPEAIKLHIRGGDNVIPTPLLELSGWYGQTEAQRREAITAYVEELAAYVPSLTGDLTTNVRNTTDISTPSVLLSIPADRALAGLKSGDTAAMAETMYQNVLAWEDELFIANKVQGIIDANASLTDYRYPMTTRQNIRYMRMFAGAFMYAAGNHVGVGYGSTAALVQGRPAVQTGPGKSNGLFGWGIAHEIGHNMDKLGRAEITNNIYSLALQAWDNGSMELDTRLTIGNIWNGVYDKVSEGRPGTANNVFVQLGMYWQLHLAYDGGETPLAFYNEFFRRWKDGEFSQFSYEDRVAVLASHVAEKDLSGFFTRWGMVLSDEAKAEMSKFGEELRALWYLNDGSRAYRLGGGAANSGETTLSAAVEDNTVTLTVSNTDPESILGYEIRRNGRPVGFTTDGSYEDNLGAANNLTYTYSAVPVDKLGNMGGEVTGQEVRIAWDKTVDPELYTQSQEEDGTILITMKQGSVPVTGIKVAEELAGASCTVEVKASASDEGWTTAKDGALTGTVTYFNKPGAAPDDTRIWTYDTAVMRITGLPAGSTVELLDYPGDRIDFYEGAAVGVLAEEYAYEGGSIPAGTLVVLGTYRGDPVYNTVEIQARYSTVLDGAEDASVIERPMKGYALLFAEIPDDGEVSDISDGFFLFVPDMDAEEALNQQSGVTDSHPFEIRAVLYRTDTPDGAPHSSGAPGRRTTSQTLWISFPEWEEETAFPSIALRGGH